jgi:hypothetical protein
MPKFTAKGVVSFSPSARKFQLMFFSDCWVLAAFPAPQCQDAITSLLV